MEKSVFKYSIDPQSVDFTGRMSVSAMFNLILGAAGEDAHSRGFGVDALAKNNSGWVLSRICFELERLPKEYEQMTLNTWISDYNRLSSTRNFVLYDASGAEFGRAVSQWCMLDFTTRRPVHHRASFHADWRASRANLLPSIRWRIAISISTAI